MERTIKAISRFSRMISDAEARAKEFCEANDLTSSQINYLETIGELGNPNITELSVALGVKKPSATVAVERLITKGCVYKTHSDDDRRSSHLHLTDVGEQVNMRHRIAHEYVAACIRNSLDTKEQGLLTELLEKLQPSKQQITTSK